MKGITALTIVLCTLLSVSSFSQDRRATRAAERSFSAAERSYRNDEFKEAAQGYEIAFEGISSRTESRSDLSMKLDANLKLIDIYFNQSVNLSRACEMVDEYERLMNSVRNSGILRSRELADYLQKQKDNDKLKERCKTIKGLDDDSDAFGKKFDEEFDE